MSAASLKLTQKLTAWWKLAMLDYHINYWSDWSDWRMCVEAEMGLMETAAELPPPPPPPHLLLSSSGGPAQ